ncbi:DUF2933 domain-containing protein [Rubrivivax sp. RP6-9]|uniref:DUF2933 domain-containing protein n=1 Tax=Rubrivivax sp. RP6-9 TaxID=3415750 RepID=UPI003CC61964
MDHRYDEAPPFRRSPAGWALALVVAVGGFYLVTEHTAHLFGALPYLFLLACPLMHVFMHRGHGHKGHGQHRSSDDEQRRQ